MRPVCENPEQRPILKVKVAGYPQILIHPMAQQPDPEINIVCQILDVVHRGYESEDWDPTIEQPIQAVICSGSVKEVPPIGVEVPVTVYDDWYNGVLPEKRVVRLVITKYPL